MRSCDSLNASTTDSCAAICSGCPPAPRPTNQRISTTSPLTLSSSAAAASSVVAASSVAASSSASSSAASSPVVASAVSVVSVVASSSAWVVVPVLSVPLQAAASTQITSSGMNLLSRTSIALPPSLAFTLVGLVAQGLSDSTPAAPSSSPGLPGSICPVLSGRASTPATGVLRSSTGG